MKSIAMLSTLISITSCAQTDRAAEKIRKENNTANLEILKERQKKKSQTADQLQAEAKRRNIPYRKEVNGKIYELQGFDKSGSPIYYTTNATRN